MIVGSWQPAMCLLWEQRGSTEWKEVDQKLAAEVIPLVLQSDFRGPVLALCLLPGN